MEYIIRQENKSDYDKVYEVVKLAFENMEYADGDEQDLVNRLRKSAAYIPELSLVAELNGEIIGHIMFTKASVEGKTCLTLAPLAILPKYQKQGVGSALINEGHRIAKELGYSVIIVVGHEKYYPKFGYDRASKYGITSSFDVPDEAFMIIELIPSALSDFSGKFELAKEFFEKETGSD